MISIVVPGWKEPDENVRTALTSLAEQDVVQRYPERFEFIFVGCHGINMEIPSKYADKLFCVNGKLRARHEATKASSGSIIVSADCDTYYPSDSLGKLLKPFEDPKVVATTGTTALPTPLWVLKPLVHLYWSTKMLGRFSAYRKWAYFKTGGFDFSYDRTEPHVMMEEEEYNLYCKLAKYGRIELVDTKVMHLDWKGSGRGLRASLLK